MDGQFQRRKTVTNIIDIWITRENLEPQRGAGKPRTSRTDDIITYTEYMKTIKASTYTKQI